MNRDRPRGADPTAALTGRLRVALTESSAMLVPVLAVLPIVVPRRAGSRPPPAGAGPTGAAGPT